MSSYYASSSQAMGRQLKTQRLVIPFQIVGHATPASKTRAVDEPSVLFLKLEGIDDVTGALASGETITFTDAASDASGIFNCLVKTGRSVDKVCRATVYRRSTTKTEADDVYTVSLGDADGLTSAANIALTVTGTALTSGTHNLCLEVEYVEAE